MSRKRVFFYVQHLLGIGHLRRATTLARAMHDDGLEVTLVSGGSPVPGLDIGGARLVQLPPTRAGDPKFNALVDEQGRKIDDAWRQRRSDLLLETWRRLDPQVMLFEMFPFGRRQMRFELMPLLQAARQAVRRPAILSSVRDVLVTHRKPGRHEEMLETVAGYFDHILVHGDPNVIRFDETFPLADRIADRLTYTGYVVDRERGLGPASGGSDGEVIVSTGSGAVGARLLRVALAARPLSRLSTATWRVLTGITAPPDDLPRDAGEADSGIIVERARDDFPALLKNCRVSISQGGYNTMMDLMNARCRAVVVPYAGGDETEQMLRARRLAAHGSMHILDEAQLTPGSLAAAVDAALDDAPFSPAGIDTAGAETTARLVHRWAERVSW